MGPGSAEQRAGRCTASGTRTLTAATIGGKAPLSFRACRPQIKRHDFTIARYQNLPGTPDPRADGAAPPFEVAPLELRGRLTRLGSAPDEILTKHDYPPPVGKLLGEAIVLTTLLGSSLKFDGRFILQTQTDGPVSFLF